MNFLFPSIVECLRETRNVLLQCKQEHSRFIFKEKHLFHLISRFQRIQSDLSVNRKMARTFFSKNCLQLEAVLIIHLSIYMTSLAFSNEFRHFLGGYLNWLSFFYLCTLAWSLVKPADVPAIRLASVVQFFWIVIYLMGAFVAVNKYSYRWTEMSACSVAVILQIVSFVILVCLTRKRLAANKIEISPAEEINAEPGIISTVSDSIQNGQSKENGEEGVALV